jgi:hypothetical protein
MNTEQVGQKVVELVRKQAWHEALDTLYDKDIVSVEARTMDGSSPEARGIKGVREKVDWWLENMQVHSFQANGPFVAHDRFAVQFDADVTDKKLESAEATVRSRRLHGEERKDRPRRVSALYGERIKPI